MGHENPFIFLIRTLIDIYAMILMLRFLLQQLGADFYNPVSQFLVKATSPVVKPLRRIIPGFRGVDLATLILVLFFIALKVFIVASARGYSFDLFSLLYTSTIELVILVINIFMFAVIIQAILSWLNPDPYNPVSSILHVLTAPVLRPIQRLIPTAGGFDFSPIFAIIGLAFLKSIVLWLT